ncbi:MAG TPA: DUF2905 domain-containing protein [Longimicrobiales bacterium]
MTTGGVGRLFLVLAVLLAVAGLVLLALDRFGVGRLPGDIVWRRDNVTIYVPLGVMILLSVLLTLLLNLLLRR